MPNPSDPTSFPHPFSSIYQINQEDPTDNPSVNRVLRAVTQAIGVGPSQVPPEVPGFTSSQVMLMSRLQQTRSIYDDAFLRFDPLSRLLDRIDSPGLQSIRDKYHDQVANANRQIMMHPAGQWAMGGNLYGGFNELMDASSYFARGPLALTPSMGVYAQAQDIGMGRAAGMSMALMNQIYPGGRSTPDPAFTRGFSVEAPFQVMAQQAVRGASTAYDPMGRPFRTRGAEGMLAATGENLEMLSAARTVFGDMPAMDLLRNTERMMGTDPMQDPREFKRRLYKFAALAQAVGENAQTLVEVNQAMLAAIGGGLGGGGGGMGRPLGGFSGSMGGTIPMSGMGGSLGGWVENQAQIYTNDYTRALGVRKFMGGSMTDAARNELLMGVGELAAREEGSSAGRATKMLRLLQGWGMLSSQDQALYDQANRYGSRQLLGQTMRDVSQRLWMDPNVLSQTANNEAQFNDFMATYTRGMPAGEAYRWQQMAHGDLSRYRQGEARERGRAWATERIYGGATGALARAGITPEWGPADEAGYKAMHDALATRPGISDPDRARMLETLEDWHGFPRQVIAQKMRESIVFRGQDVTEITQAGELGASRVLAGQALTAARDGSGSLTAEAAQVFSHAGSKVPRQAIDAARQRFYQLLSKHDFTGARAALNAFATKWLRPGWQEGGEYRKRVRDEVLANAEAAQTGGQAERMGPSLGSPWFDGTPLTKVGRLVSQLAREALEDLNTPLALKTVALGAANVGAIRKAEVDVRGQQDELARTIADLVDKTSKVYDEQNTAIKVIVVNKPPVAAPKQKRSEWLDWFGVPE